MGGTKVSVELTFRAIIFRRVIIDEAQHHQPVI